MVFLFLRKDIMKENLYLSMYHESYPTIIDGHKALIRVDLKAKEVAPLAVHTYYLRLPYDMGLDGIPSETEMTRMSAETVLIEDALMSAEAPISSVGSMMYNGIDTHVYVSEQELDAHQLFDPILETLNIKNYACGAFINDNWSFYDETLYPTIYDHNTIINRNQCMQLETMINTTVAVPIDFYFSFKAIDAAQNFMSEIASTFELVSSETDQNNLIRIQLNATIAPTFKNMNIMTQTLIKASMDHDGDFIGWGVSNLDE